MDSEKSAALLEGILETLKSINGNFAAQEKRWKWLEERLDDKVLGDQAERAPLAIPIEGRDTIEDAGQKGEPGFVKRTANFDNQAEERNPPRVPSVHSRSVSMDGGSSISHQSFTIRSKLPRLNDDDGERFSASGDSQGSLTDLPPLPKSGSTSLVQQSLNPDSRRASAASGSLRLLERGRRPSNVNSLAELENSTAWMIESKVRKVEMMEYRDWGTPLVDSHLHKNDLLQKELGDAWTIPDDGRLPLRFSRPMLEKLSKSDIENLIPQLSNFRDKMARDAFVDFKIVDSYETPVWGRHSHRRQMTYRLGEPVRGAVRVPTQDLDESPVFGPDALNWDRLHRSNNDAPWRRFIFCQGLNTAQPQPEWIFRGDDNDESKPHRCAPFLFGHYRTFNWGYYYTGITDHISCRRLTSSIYSYSQDHINLYDDLQMPFHITFFEILPSYMSKHKKYDERGRWSHGHLYSGESDERLCESAFTLIEIPGLTEPHRWYLDRKPGEVSKSWTILLLTPPLFTSRRSSTPHLMVGPMHSMALYLILDCFQKLRARWLALRDHLEHLLDERQALMSPKDHDELLWDDELFTRSRKYFWAIHCLTEFHLSISDNILQWENYNEARIQPLEKAGQLNEDDFINLKELDEACTALKNLRSYFSEQLISTKALRDGLFNASAVVESRASTRLGENVKLLTFVSIFFLPLAFCTSLWSINNMFSTKTLIYTIIIIGLTTYAIVFNLNNLVLQFSRSYQSLRDRLVSQMKEVKDESRFWTEKGERFDVFRPQHEKPHPSEWWIVIFLTRTLFVKVSGVLHFWASKDKDGDKKSSASSDGFSIASSRSSYSAASSTSRLGAFGAADAVSDHIISSADQGAKPPVESTGTDHEGQKPSSQPQRPLDAVPNSTISPKMNTSNAEKTTHESGSTSIPSSPTPPPPAKRRHFAGRAISKIFRRRKRPGPALDNGQV